MVYYSFPSVSVVSIEYCGFLFLSFITATVLLGTSTTLCVAVFFFVEAVPFWLVDDFEALPCPVTEVFFFGGVFKHLCLDGVSFGVVLS